MKNRSLLNYNYIDLKITNPTTLQKDKELVKTNNYLNCRNIIVVTVGYTK